MTFSQDAELLRQASDPQTPAATLAHLAEHYPQVRPALAANPSTYPDLLSWLGALGDPQIAAALASRGAPLPPITAEPAAPPAPVAPEPPAISSAPTYVPEQGAQAPQPGQSQYQGQPQYAGQPQYQGQPQQPGQPAQNGQAYAGPPMAGVQYGGQPPAAPPKRKRTVLWVSIAAVVALIVVGGGVAWALVFSKLGGASSPQAAVEKLIDGIKNFDEISIYGALSPAETATFKDSFTKLSELQVELPDGEKERYEDLSKQALEAITLSVDNLTFDAQTVDEGITKVVFTGGTLNADADVEKLADAIVELSKAQAAIGGGAVFEGMSEEELNEIYAQLRTQIVDGLGSGLPFSYTAQQFQSELGFPLSLMTVQEGGSWYVSPMLSVAELAADSSGASSTRGTVPTGDELDRFDSPEAAASGFVTAISDTITSGSWQELAKALPLAERRLVALYGDVLVPIPAGGTALPVTTNEFGSDQRDGDTARVQVKDLTVDFGGYPFTLSGLCLSSESSYTGPQSYCLTDIPGLVELGVADVDLIALQQDGSWFLSPVATSADALAIFTENIIRLQQEGKFTDPNWLQENFGGLGGLGGYGGIGSSSAYGGSLDTLDY